MKSLLKPLLIPLFTLALLAGFFALPSSGPQAATPPLLGFHIDKGDAAHIEAARAAGGHFVVVVFGWDTIEPEPNRLYWEVPDAALRAAEFYGLEVVARLDRPPAWALDDAGPSPWNLAAYETFTRRVAERYGERLAGVIIWNEPNLSLEWRNQPPSAPDYVQLLQHGYRGVKATAPNLPVLLAGLAFTTTADATAANDLDFLRAIYNAGGAPYFDVVAAHPYGFGRSPGEPPAPDQLNFRRLELHRDIMEEYGDAAKPVWITEMGWRTGAPNPDDRWQVVTPEQQIAYTFQAIDLAASYPWLERLALWELNGRGDDYGYDLWHGPEDISPTYAALVDFCERRPGCAQTATVSRTRALDQPVDILAPDVIIRLGDRGTLHPHWVHLHRGGQNFSPDWQGEFFLTRTQAGQPYDLLLETMQVDQPTNRMRLNGLEVATLQPRTRPDPTSTWASQRFSVPPDLLRPGRNTLDIRAGLRNPARQYSFWRWENFQVRHIRLSPVGETWSVKACFDQQDRPCPPSALFDWQPLPAPSGWSETNRLRPGLDDDFWLTGNRPGELWRGAKPAPNAPTRLHNQAANRPDLLFTDVLPLPAGLLATTDRGLFWRPAGAENWSAVEKAPERYGYVVLQAGGRFYAGFEEGGLWSAPSPTGPWQPDGLAGLTALDARFDAAAGQLYAATNNGVYARKAPAAAWLPLPAWPGSSDTDANPLTRFASRLYLGRQGEVVVRNLDQLWRYEVGIGWQPFGPPALHQTNRLYSVLNCCEAGAVVGANNAGLWQLANDGAWQRLDDGLFDRTDVTDFVQVNGTLYGAGIVALLESVDGGRSWSKVEGLPQTVTDLIIDPADPARWLAATPAGLYRSEDSGRSWQPASPPWTVWDMALGPGGRLFVGRTRGVAFTDDLSAANLVWTEADGLEDVLFFSVNPHPAETEIVAGGAWGNNLALSRNGGHRLASLHNGLETLSVLDVLWHPTPGQLTVGTIEGLYRTDDLGETWFKLPGPLEQQTVYSLLQTADSTIWAGAADGVWSSRDYGVTWQPVKTIPAATIGRLGQFSLAGEDWLWAGAEQAGLWLSRDNGASWQFGGLPAASVYALRVDPGQPARLVAATSEGIFSALIVLPER